MCGILFTNKNIENIEDVITFLKNRGPDFTNNININGYNFVHVLLSMTGNNLTIQPFTYNNNSIVILFNGEIYNYKEFGEFNSDGECIIESYLKHGDNFIKYLDGEFAIALIDFNINKLFFSSDIFCIKPLWYSIENNHIGISTYKSCLEKLNFNNIMEVPHNTTFHIDISDNYKIIKKTSVYDFDLKQYKTSFDDWNKAFENSIIKRTKGIKHKIFIGLSSGYDSGLIACVLNKFNIDYKAYTIEGSENTETINKRNLLHDNYKILKISEEEFNKQKEYLLSKCEDYNLFIDNDELSNLNFWENQKDEYLKKNDNLNSNEYKKILSKIEYYQQIYNKALDKKIYEDNGAIGLGIICKEARPLDELIYLTGSGADEITSDYGWNGVRHYRHSTIGGYFPDDLSTVFPWRNFFSNTQKAYLRKEEYVAGTYGIEGRYPFLDKYVVQEFLWLSNELKNKWYKSPICNYLKNNNYPFDENKKIGFNCGMSDGTEKNINKKIATRTQIGETNDETLRIKIK